MAYTKEQAIQRAFDKANLDDQCDIYRAIYSFKALISLPDSEIEEIYNQIAERLGLTQN